ncbi:DNA repair protein rad8 [Lasiodiplodia theobromae]|uniref:DNA repair protein rad8 n=1 Tax=Lasiodiplodia theobromae TaxID=45133 RepID=A0A5N5D1H7_9PEZI|nr:DNA repair protein rad8 [Lasiodiplodia theobromae]
MLDQIGKALFANNLCFERIDGSKSDSQRRTALDRFRNDPDCCILLASIGSAGVGLDLTVASCVHLMEPQWSPMAEEQALDRIHRMGQTRDVVATRYVVKNSIEEYVISVQEMKSKVIKQSFDAGAATEVSNLRERLMKYLEQS